MEEGEGGVGRPLAVEEERGVVEVHAGTQRELREHRAEDGVVAPVSVAAADLVEGERQPVADRVSPLLENLYRERDRVAPFWDVPGSPWHERYDEYLRSDEWLALRRLVLRRDGYRCRHTGKASRPGDPLQVHHLTYERVGAERLDDLITLCRSAHQRLHDLAKVS